MEISKEDEELNASSDCLDLSSSDATSTDVPSELTLLSDGSLTTLSALENMHPESNAPSEAYFKSLTDSELNWELHKQALKKCVKNRVSPGKDVDNSSKLEDIAYDNLTDEDEDNAYVYEDEQTTTDDGGKGPRQGAIVDPSEATEYSEVMTHCDPRSTSSQDTRDLLKHYLENSDSVDDLKIYKLEPSKCCKQFLKHLVNLLNFMILIITSKPFWNTCVIITNVLASVFFYLVLAVSTIIINLILNIHDAMLMPEAKETRETLPKKKTHMERIVRFPDIDELIKMPN